ncbi:MAG: transposase [Glaciecola sp.]|jgi:transposase
MNKYKETFGVDISKDVFDVHGSTVGHNQYSNDESGFKKFLKELPESSLVVMEATGYYHYQLAYHLLESGIKVSVENPLSVNRFIQMKLSEIKIDKSDSKLICEYAQKVELKQWEGNSKEEMECLQITRGFWLYAKQSTMLKKKLHGEAVFGGPSKAVIRSLKRSLKHLQKEM